MAYDKIVDSAFLDSKLIAIANAIRGKTGGAEPLTLDQMATAISAIEVGTGGSSVAYRGSFTPAENLSTVTVDVGGEFTNFLLQAYSDVRGNGVKATQMFSINTEEQYGHYVSTNNGGTAYIGGEFSYNADSGRYTTGNETSYVEISGNSITAVGVVSETVLGQFLSGVTYIWYAW